MFEGFFLGVIVLALKNLRENYLVPRHELVSKEKSQEVIEGFGGSVEKIPQILKTDPIVLELEAKKGDLIKITRKSLTAGTTIYYRIVVSR